MKRTIPITLCIIIAFIILLKYTRKSEIEVVVKRVKQDSITYILSPVRLADGNLKPLVAELWYGISTKDSLDRLRSLTWLRSRAGSVIQGEAAKTNTAELDTNIDALVTRCNQVLISNYSYAVYAMMESERPAVVPMIRVKSLDISEALTVVEVDSGKSE